MSLSNDDRRALVVYRVEKARATFGEAQKVATVSLWNLAANRLYYALYYAASALLLSDGLTSHTHKGLLAQVSLNYVKDGRLTQSDGKLLRQMFNMRQEGDYEDFAETSEEDIKEAMPRVRELMEKLITLNKLAV